MLATSVNFLPAALGWENLPELAVLAVLHLVFINRVRLARVRGVAARRGLERFSARDGGDGGTEGRNEIGAEAFLP